MRRATTRLRSIRKRNTRGNKNVGKCYSGTNSSVNNVERSNEQGLNKTQKVNYSTPHEGPWDISLNTPHHRPGRGHERTFVSDYRNSLRKHQFERGEIKKKQWTGDRGGQLDKMIEPRSSTDFIAMEEKYGAKNYKPLPVVLKYGKGVFVWDVEGKRYFDFLAGYSALNQGHRHPKIIEAFTHQLSNLTLTSRAFHNDVLGRYERYITEYFGYDKVLPMNTGVEGAETALKICRKWAYEVKGVPPNQATVLFPAGNFWGRTIAAASASSDPKTYNNFGPFVPGFEKVPFGDLAALEEQLKKPNCAGYYFEPILGEAGVIIPKDGYLREAKKLCEKYNVLYIADEIQTGLGRTGRLLANDHEYIKPDILVLGKALSGGTIPISAVLAMEPVMNVINPGEHGSTYGGNPLASRVAMAALEVIQEEGLSENSEALGIRLLKELKELGKKHSDFIKEVRGRGLFCAVELRPEASERITARGLCLRLKDAGLLAKETHDHIIRFAPPLVISRPEIDEAIDIMKQVFSQV
eukprot:TRINITY_DN2743_c0_g1_i1.p1 TRINITY_DN2743_c0_g1~~TRINITY_DN2743_c0_g1_i1.p1  ORF type:complete len:524 (-),score=107.52 TRINITY_DN2743_c0_g1_i1:56-1627(-)